MSFGEGGWGDGGTGLNGWRRSNDFGSCHFSTRQCFIFNSLLSQKYCKKLNLTHHSGPRKELKSALRLDGFTLLGGAESGFRVNEKVRLMWRRRGGASSAGSGGAASWGSRSASIGDQPVHGPTWNPLYFPNSDKKTNNKPKKFQINCKTKGSFARIKGKLKYESLENKSLCFKRRSDATGW